MQKPIKMKMLLGLLVLSAAQVFAFETVVRPLPGEKWWGGALMDGAAMPYGNTPKPVDLGRDGRGGAVAPFLVSSAGRYVWSERPFVYALTNDTLYVNSSVEMLEPVQAGTTLKEAYLAASQEHFPFDGRMPADLLFTLPQWNNWVEIAIQGMNQKSVDAYTDALAESGFPCGVYMMDGGWLTHQGSFEFNADFPDPKGMFDRIRAQGWKTMIWIAHMVSGDSYEAKLRRHARGYRIDGRDVLAYRKDNPRTKEPGMMWWWSGVSAVWDLTYAPGRADYLECLKTFAARYGLDGFKFDAGDLRPLSATLAFHDPAAEAADYAYWYARIAGDNFSYNEIRAGFRTGGLPVMQRLHDQHHSWKALAKVSGCVQAAGMIGSPYVVADMIGGGEAQTFRPDNFFSEKLFLRSCAMQALQPMMQFSAAPWRYLSAEGQAACRRFADLHVAFGPYILELARQAAKTGEPIVRPMEYQFPHQGFGKPMAQFMLGPRWLVAPVTREDDSLVVELPAGSWRDDGGETHVGPTTLRYEHVPTDRLVRFERIDL